MAVGLAVTGSASLALLTLVDYKLPTKTAQNAFSQWWLITTLLITPFGVFEAYLARLVVAERAGGRDPSPVIANLIGRSWMIAAGISVGVLCLGPWLNSAEFGHHAGLVLLLPVWVFILATQAAQRGVATGEGRFPAIAVQLSTDGVLRIGLAAAIAFSGHPDVDLIALATCVSATLAIVVAGFWCPGWYVRPSLRQVGVSWRPILLLLVASVCPVLAGNAPSPWLNAVYPNHADTAITFAAAVFLSRIPTQFVSAAFGPLLSHLTHAAETGDAATFHRLTRMADLTAVVLGAVFVLAFAVIGVRLLPVYANTPKAAQLSIETLAVLALASALMFITVVQQASLAATSRWNTIAAAWVIGLVSLGVVLALPISALHRATAAPAAAIGTALVVMLVRRAPVGSA